MADISQLTYTIAVWLLPVLFAITLHEAAHGWVANKLGDPTAKKLGRVSLNPVKHIDPIGTIVVPLVLVVFGGFILGWAKPVPVNTRYFNKPLTDMAMVALAGPLSNLLMACCWAFIIILLHTFLPQLSPKGFLQEMATKGIIINVVLMVLNLIPIPPLDGSRVLAGVLPQSLVYPYMKLERYGMMIVLVLLMSGILGKIMWPMVIYFVNLIGFIFGI